MCYYWSLYFFGCKDFLNSKYFEESAWRGYLTARLLSLKIKGVWLYLIVGVVWCSWHWPYFFYFVKPQQLFAVFPYDKVTFCLMALVCCTSWTVMYTELFRLTKSIWPGVWMHAIEDSTINSLIYDKHIFIETGRDILISPVSGMIPCLLYLGVGLWLRELRMTRDEWWVTKTPRDASYIGSLHTGSLFIVCRATIKN